MWVLHPAHNSWLLDFEWNYLTIIILHVERGSVLLCTFVLDWLLLWLEAFVRYLSFWGYYFLWYLGSIGLLLRILWVRRDLTSRSCTLKFLCTIHRANSSWTCLAFTPHWIEIYLATSSGCLWNWIATVLSSYIFFTILIFLLCCLLSPDLCFE